MGTTDYHAQQIIEALQQIREAEHALYNLPRLRDNAQECDDAEEDLDEAIGWFQSFFNTPFPLTTLCLAFELLIELGLKPDINAYTEAELAVLRDAIKAVS